MAQQKAPADIIKARQDLMKALGADFKIINDQLKTESPDKAAISTAIKRIADNSKGVADRFPAGTGKEAGVKTRALPEIWTQMADFKTAADALATASAKFVPVAAGGDIEAIKGEAKALGGACGGCHRKFRVPDEPAAK